MKHLKLFESFDRYEFGHFDNVESNAVRMEYVERNLINFTREEREAIEQSLESCEIEYELNRYDIIVTKDEGDYARELISIFSLGDYCYVVAQYDRFYNEEVDELVEIYHDVWVIDQMDELIEKLDQINKSIG